MKKSVGLWLVGFFTLILGALIFLGPLNILSSLILLMSGDTEYAPGYSESSFRRVAIGETEGDVRATLGTPLSEGSAEPYTEWLFAPDPNLASAFREDGKYPDMGFSFTTIRFGENGVFSNVLGQISHGMNRGILGVSGSASIGDGMNTLSLTQLEIEKLRKEAASPDTIESRFGKPDAVFQSRVVKWLYYSRSPSSKNYRQRFIGIDREGRVCRKESEIYWE